MHAGSCADAVAIVISDFRSLRRSLVRSPGQAVTVWVCTAIWMALAPAFFCLLGILQWKSLPFPSPARIVQVNAGLDLVPVLAASGRFQAVSGFEAGWVVVEGPSGSATVLGAAVDESFFDVLAIRPVRGRVFAPSSSGSPDLGGIVLAESLGRRLFGERGPPADALIRAGGRKLAVLGIAPDHPAFPPLTELWVLRSSGNSLQVSFLPQGVPSLGILGRLTDVTSLQAADATVQMAARELERRESVSQGDVEVVTLEELLRRRSPGERAVLTVSLTGLLGLVLLAYSSALAAFFIERQGEFAIRTALGARRSHLIRFLLLRLAILAIPGILTGLPIAILVLDRLSSLVPFSLVELLPPRLDAESLALSLAGWILVMLLSISIVWLTVPGAGLSVALAPDRTAPRRTRPQARIRLALVCAALSLAVSLGIVASILKQSFGNLRREPLGFEAAGVVSTVIRFTGPPAPGQLPTLLARLGQRIGSMPGVAAVSFSDAIPFGSPLQHLEVSNPDRSQFWMGRVQRVHGDFWRALGVRPVAGRGFSALEQETGAPVALLDAQGGRQIFGNGSFLGRTIFVGENPVEIVGVVDPMKGSSLEEPSQPQIYLPLVRNDRKNGPASLAMIVRLSAPVTEADLFAAVRSAAPGASASQYRPIEAGVEASLAPRRLARDLASLQWMAVLVLVALAAFGTFAWSLEVRSFELAVRLALGDTERGIAGRALRSAALITMVSVLLGLATYIPVGDALRALIFRVDVLSPLALFQTILVVGGVALGAAALGARSALRHLSLNLLKTLPR